ncbi:MAG TPA: hypothetical protein VKX49_24670 [Bryobacteraceae bacterium]|nr:hypothetical protein [Bryobacteraceae bacterium]
MSRNACSWTVTPRLTVAGLCAVLSVFGQVNVLTANYDNNRTNANLSETQLSPKTVSPATFGKVGTFPVDGQIYAQPLYASGVQVSGAAKRNVVYVATMHNSVYAFDADAPQSIQPLWKVNLGPSILSAVFNFTDILPEVGILSTPAIDLSRGVIYVVSDTLDGGAPVFRLHALSLVDGSEQLNGPVTITAAVPGTGGGSDGNGILPLDASLHLQRPGLALANGELYISFGSHADMGDWHGWLIGYDASNLRNQTSVFNSTPNGWGGSIWQAGRAPAIDENGDIYVVTGNGDYDGLSSFSESLLHISIGRGRTSSRSTLSLQDWFTPDNWPVLNDSDWDFGTTGTILVPGTNLLLAGSKAGVLYAIPRDALGHSRAAFNNVQSVQANQWGMFDMALWNRDGGPVVYVAEPFNALKAFSISNGRLSQTSSSQYSICSSFFAGLAVSADQGKDGTGIVWLTTGNRGISGVPGTLHALDASNLAHEMWSSDMNADRDGLGRFAKFVAPTVANGRVYVPTFSNALVVYGPLSGAGANGVPQVTAVVNGASFVGGPVSAGEIVAIFGANLGVSELTGLQLDSTGKVSKSLAGTQVLVNGLPVPVLYVSGTQVGAVTPFGLSGPTAQFQVVYNGHTSAALMVPVAPSAPGLFSSNGNGGGVGIIDSDGTTSDYTGSSEAGSVVTFYATGAGQTIPAAVDGAPTPDGGPYPTPVLPVSVLIDGQNAQVLYAGAAPGMVAGVLQINVLVPDTVWGDDLQVMVKVGEAVTPNFLWLHVE